MKETEGTRPLQSPYARSLNSSLFVRVCKQHLHVRVKRLHDRKILSPSGCESMVQ